jgi:MFS family permease
MLSSVKASWPSGGLWRHPDFLKLWAGQTISEFGTQFSLIALPLTAIYVLHASAFAVAALTIFEQLPFLLFALPAGVWVDRLARRPILIVGDAGRALALASIPIAYAAGALHMGQLFAVAFVVGVLTVFFDVAYQSYLPSLVERDQLVEGNSKLQGSASIAQLGGPGVAGPLVKLASAPYAILADVGSFIASSAFVLSIRRPETAPGREPADRRGMKHELMEGLRYVLRHRHLRAIAACTANSNFFGNVAYAILFVYFVRRLDLSATLIGVMLSCSNLGLVLGAFTAGWIGRRYGVGRTLVWSAVAVGPSLLLIPAAPTGFPVPVLVVALMLFGFSGVVYNITQISLRQAITPERLQGRMNSVMRFIVWGVLPLGALLGGLLATTIGLRATLWIAGAGGSLSWLPVAFSPVRSLVQVPQHEPQVATALEPGPVGGVILGYEDEELATPAAVPPADA